MRAPKYRPALERLELRQLLAADLVHEHDWHASPLPVGPFPPAVVLPGERAPLTSLPLLSSNPAAAAKLFLDFDGRFEATWAFKTNVTTPAFDQDGNASDYSPGELAAIDEIWRRVAEDYAPFNVDVTTIDPGAMIDRVVAVVAIGGNWSDWYGSAAGGVAFVGGFANFSSNLGFVFSQALGNSPKSVAEAAAHEAGHLFGLSHQARWDGTTMTQAYHTGDGDWAPIMGNSYGPSRTTWHNGTTNASSTTFQNDLSIIASATNNFGYKVDDHGDTLATATALTPTAAGLIGGHVAADLDLFQFTTGGGQATFSISLPLGANLDTQLRLLNSSGSQIASDSPAGSYTAALSLTLAAGTYYVEVSPTSIYGNVGSYTLNSQVVEAVADVTYWLNGEATQPGTTIAFGASATGEENIQYLTLTNDGTPPVTISGVSVPAGFSLLEAFQPTVLEEGESLNLEIVMDTTTPGQRSGTLAISGDVAVSFPLTGQVVQAGIAQVLVNGQPLADGSTYSFGALNKLADVEQAFTIINVGESELSLLDVAVTGDYLVSGDTFGILGQGESFTVFVSPNTELEGSVPGTLVVTTDNGTTTIQLAATVQGANIAVAAGTTPLLSGDTFDFGARAIKARVKQVFTISNNGVQQLTLGKVTVPPSVLLLKNITKTKLLPGQSTSFTVQLKTNLAGPVSGQISIASNDADTPQFVINLTGQIVGPQLSLLHQAAPVDNVTLFHFGSVPKGSVVTRQFQLVNTGLAPLTINSLSVPRGFKVTTSPAVTKLAAGQTITLTVRMDTSRAGSYLGSLVIRTNSLTLSVFTVRLQGEVTAPAAAPKK